jgi:NMD protein affecting ribosome stability and mRNA decay
VKALRTSDATRHRRDRLIREAVHDPYKAAAKPAEPSVCRDCGVVFSGGRWHWSPELPISRADALCPACQRIRDQVPAGFLTLSGDFLKAHHDEIMHLLRNTVDAQQKDHPLKRIMRTAESAQGTEVTFTDNHLPRTVGAAIRRAYGGELDIQFAGESSIIRVYWRRND